MSLFVLLFSSYIAYSQPVLLTTKQALTADQTFSDLKLLPRLHPTTNFTVDLEFKVIQQNRIKTPNPWESFWIFWSYNKDDGNLKRTNYLAFKTNGLEIGKAYNIISQDFIWTTNTDSIVLNKWHQVQLNFKDFGLTIIMDNKLISILPQLLKQTYLNPGRIGLYSEDANIEIRNIEMTYP